MKPEISLIVPSYNVGNFVENSLASIWGQTLDPSLFEVIIVDDGSTDGSPYRIAEAVKGRNVGFFARNENRGAAFTRNEAIKYSYGNFISLLDADDILEPGALESALTFMKENPRVQYSYSMHRRIYPDGSIENRPVYNFSKRRLEHFNFVGPLTTFTRSLHDAIGGFDESVNSAEDWDHVLRASEILDENQIARNPVFLYNYIIRKGGKSRVNIIKRRRTISDFIERHLQREGLDAKVFWSHMTKDGYNYFDWEKAVEYPQLNSPFDTLVRRYLGIPEGE